MTNILYNAQARQGNFKTVLLDLGLKGLGNLLAIRETQHPSLGDYASLILPSVFLARAVSSTFRTISNASY